MFSGFENGDPRFTVLETNKFRARPVHEKRNDYSDSGLGTKVASKVVGQWSTAKDATLVSVLFNPDDESNMREAFEVVSRDIRRRKRKEGTEQLKAVSINYFYRSDRITITKRLPLTL